MQFNINKLISLNRELPNLSVNSIIKTGFGSSFKPVGLNPII